MKPVDVGYSSLLVRCTAKVQSPGELINNIAKAHAGVSVFGVAKIHFTTSQAVVMGWAPLVSASFLFIWACNWVGAIIPWSFIEIPSGELAAPTNDINVTTFLAL